MRFLNLARLQSKCDDNAVNSSEDLEQKSRKTMGIVKRNYLMACLSLKWSTN